MKITFIILGVAISVFAIAHSISTERQREQFIEFCHEQHIAEVGNVVFMKFRYHYIGLCAEDWSQYRAGRETEMVKKWRKIK